MSLHLSPMPFTSAERSIIRHVPPRQVTWETAS